MLDDRGGVDDLAQTRSLGALEGEHLEQPEVADDLLARAGALDLDDDALAVGKRRLVHLRDRAGREWERVERVEHVLPRDLELFLHHRDDLGLCQRRYCVAQAGQLLDELRRDQVGPCGENLAELAERRPELLERRAQALGALTHAVLVGRRPPPGEQLLDPVLGRDTRDPRGAPGQDGLGFGLGLGLGCRDRRATATSPDLHGRCVHGDDRAVRDVRDPVRDVAQEELLVAAHARVADDDGIGVLFVGDRDDGIGRVLVDDDPGAAVRTRRFRRDPLELDERRLEVRDLGCLAVLTLGWRDEHLDEQELCPVPLGEVGGPTHGALGGLRAVGRDDDALHDRAAYDAYAAPQARTGEARCRSNPSS